MPPQESSGVKVTINMLLGGACGKVRCLGEHDVCHSQGWRRCPSHQQKHHHCKAGRCRLVVGGDCGNDGGCNNGNCVAQAATCAGARWHDASGQGKEEDAVDCGGNVIAQWGGQRRTMQQRRGRWATGSVVVATEDNNNDGWDLPPPQCRTKDVDDDDRHDQGDNRHATTMATPSTFLATDADNVKE